MWKKQTWGKKRRLRATNNEPYFNEISKEKCNMKNCIRNNSTFTITLKIQHVAKQLEGYYFWCCCVDKENERKEQRKEEMALLHSFVPFP